MSTADPSRTPDEGAEEIGCVMHVTSSGDLFGGAENALLDIVTHARSWTPLVVVPFEGAFAAAVRSAGMECTVMGLGVLRHRGELRSPVLIFRLLGGLIASARLAALIRRRQVRLVHSNTSAVTAGALAARLARVPHVWHVREVSDGFAWSILGRMIPLLSARVLCISETVARNLPPSRRNDRVVVIRDGIDTTLFAYAPHHKPTGHVLMVARLNPNKGHELFVRAAARTKVSVPGATFEMVGGFLPVYAGFRDRLVTLAAELGLDDSVTFSPHAPRSAIAAKIAFADVVVVPSVWIEPGGLVVLEGMAVGTAVVATRRGGPAEVIDDGENGFLVSHDDSAELAAAISRILLDNDLRMRITSNAIKTVEERHTLPMHIDRLRALYRDVMRSEAS